MNRSRILLALMSSYVRSNNRTRTTSQNAGSPANLGKSMTKRLWILYGNALEYIQSLPETKKRLMIPPSELSDAHHVHFNVALKCWLWLRNSGMWGCCCILTSTASISVYNPPFSNEISRIADIPPVWDLLLFAFVAFYLLKFL